MLKKYKLYFITGSFVTNKSVEFIQLPSNRVVDMKYTLFVLRL